MEAAVRAALPTPSSTSKPDTIATITALEATLEALISTAIIIEKEVEVTRVVKVPVIQTVEVTRVVQIEVTPSATPAVIDGCAAGDLVCQGQALFLTPPDNAAPQALWCSQCHTFGGVSAGLIGPDLTSLSTEGSNRKPGLLAAEFIEESIRQPEAFICEAERCTAGLMTAAVTENLTDAQINALVAFLIEPG